jgi:hypothetical protein
MLITALARDAARRRNSQFCLALSKPISPRLKLSVETTEA